MSEEAELQAKIAALTGKIKQHKQEQHASHAPSVASIPRHSASIHGYPRWSPYGRGGRGAYPYPSILHANRTLVVNGKQAASSRDFESNTIKQDKTRSDSQTPAGSLVSTRGRNKQLMTQKTYERESKQREEYKSTKEDLRKKILQDRDASSTTQPGREMEIAGIRFRLKDDGSKLMRVSEATQSSTETPRKTIVAGVTFLRTKQGNLVRATNSSTKQIRTVKRAQCEHFTKNGNEAFSSLHAFAVPGDPFPAGRPCRLGQRYGLCPYGPDCKFAHDPSKVAMCRDFLHKGSCPHGANCDLSHDPTYHRVSACTHFLRGNCTNPECRYPHVVVSPSAPVCRAFATLGFCAKGPDCEKRHVSECPDYSNHGHCPDRETGKCKLPHLDHASTLRKASERRAKIAAGEDVSDLSSDNEQDDPHGSKTTMMNTHVVDDDEIDDDDDDVVMLTMDSDNESQALSQQHDFVRFA